MTRYFPHVLLVAGLLAAGAAVGHRDPAPFAVLALVVPYLAYLAYLDQAKLDTSALDAARQQYEDAAQAIVSLTDRLVALESELAKRGLAEVFKPRTRVGS